jgi:hypothetical protein
VKYLYKSITEENLENLKNIIKDYQIQEEIYISIPELKLLINFDSLSENYPYTEYGKMEKISFLREDNVNVLAINNRSYELFISIGEWGYNTRFSDSHICLGTNPLKFGSSFFSQIELSQALEDNNYIYITKNISKLAGNGTISRLNNGLGKDKIQKFKRRDLLVKEINAEVLEHENSDWICISKIDKKEMLNEKNGQSILHRFLKEFITYAFSIEKIINSYR